MNKVVEQFQQFRLDGNIVPHSWYQSPQLAQKNGKPNLVAITLLADIIYWYRPAEIRDEVSGAHLGYRQKFTADKLQKNYRKWGDGFGFTLRQVEDAMAFLKTAGLVSVERRKVITELGTFPNCAFIEPVFEAIKTLTYPPDEKTNRPQASPPANPQRSPVETGDIPRSNGRTSPVPGGDPSRSNGRRGTLKGEHTKTSSETTKKNTSGDAPGAPPEFSASLLEESEKTLALVPQWQDLSEAEQKPFREQAAAELAKLHDGTGIKPSVRLVEVRAVNLYKLSRPSEPKNQSEPKNP